jgi:aspartyl/asparaginyl beta-hydroxylase (cupin superfamily)
MKGDCRAKARDDGAALGFYNNALRIASGLNVPAELLAELRRAEAATVALRSRLEAQRESVLAGLGLPPETRSARFQRSLDILSGKKQIFVQEPTGYYFPELPQVQFFEREAFDWVPGVESATAAIRDELEALLSTGIEGFQPYIRSEANRPRLDDNALLDNSDWSARFLCENGRRHEETIARCPRTWQAVQAAPQPRMTNSPTAMFSLLRPGARIAPHSGTHNIRLTCHLPLIVPPNCGFRVGNETREWEVGKLLIFDDTIEHEAWNESDRDRVVLIFDIWRPELSDQEKTEIAALFSGAELVRQD